MVLILLLLLILLPPPPPPLLLLLVLVLFLPVLLLLRLNPSCLFPVLTIMIPHDFMSDGVPMKSLMLIVYPVFQLSWMLVNDSVCRPLPLFPLTVPVCIICCTSFFLHTCPKNISCFCSGVSGAIPPCLPFLQLLSLICTRYFHYSCSNFHTH